MFLQLKVYALIIQGYISIFLSKVKESTDIYNIRNNEHLS